MNQETQNLSFSEIPLSAELSRAVEDMNYATATSIQAAAIPFLLDGQDVVGRSSTGTGKTAAFGIPAVECVDGNLKKAQILVLSPTRELAMQIAREMQKYCKYKEGVSVAAVYGGESMQEQIRQLRKANIVIGTPGRLMDHLRRKTLKLDEIKMIVLDEADEMLSMGFIDDIHTILLQAPQQRQTVLFSATMPPPILKISREFLNNPKIVDVVSSDNQQADINQAFYYVMQNKKQEAIKLLLQHAHTNRSIVFCNTKCMVDELAMTLSKQGIKASGLHGDMTQVIRSQVMQNFRNGNIHILIATDIAARGIDVDNVDTVINYDLPQSFEYYIHRIGRTGRAGKQGISQTLICNAQQLSTLKNLMRVTGSKIEEHRLPTKQDMMDCVVDKMAEDIVANMQKKAGKTAKMLVERMLETGAAAEDIAVALAEKLLGGDEKYDNMSGIENISAIQKEKHRVQKSEFGPSKTIVTVNVGHSTRVKPNHIVGAITEALDISSSDIGKIDISTNDTRIALCEEDALALMNLKNPMKINRQEVLFTLSQKKRSEKSPYSPKKFRGKPRRKASY